MASTVALPTYIDPCTMERINSTESVWLNASDLGECYPNDTESDSQKYPRLVPVYNGKPLDIDSELLHASLSGISIKHYHGKCFQEKEDEEESLIYQDYQTEMYGFDWVDEKSNENSETQVPPTETSRLKVSPASTTESRGYDYGESLLAEGQPLCTLPKINPRNSFWSIHRPELCKLTWGQKYVSSATVIEHLHEHLIQHGALCQGFHTEEDRIFMLNKELDEYVRLKVLACPRQLPPDEPVFEIKNEIDSQKLRKNPKCKTGKTPEIKIPTTLNDRIFPIDDDDDDEGIKEKSIHRSKEEFCLTIGKHMRDSLFVKSVPVLTEGLITPQASAKEEEDYEYFYYDWYLYNEEDYGVNSDNKSESWSTLSESFSQMEPRPLMMDDFCRAAAGKVDFSDLRCNPDF